MNREEKHILIVDDEEMYRWNITDYLEDEGFSVESVESAEKALDLVKCRSFDLLIVDMRLPGMDGNTFIMEAKKITKDVKILIHTGSVEYTIPPELAKLDITKDQIFYKPIESMDSLIKQIEHQLGG